MFVIHRKHFEIFFPGKNSEISAAELKKSSKKFKPMACQILPFPPRRYTTLRWISSPNAYKKEGR
ncbi:Protein CBG25875 [Caenorhabditis briggsae]|uniref:Protein CBG25875 n=1 Tax=Caenorhabditis briggsae TaxID=6238 RepID=B6IHN0_CAEBR|nr:Protein CBG25875 [Caenorhabditis briggsae]CAR99386.1 Protein CBG25875 [Caenorhabditis briggsae]